MPHKIKWCDETLNVFTGCSMCSVGCLNCFAEKFTHRLANICVATGKNPQYLGKTDLDGHWTGKIEFCPSMFERLKHWHKSRLIFINDMSDTFHEKAKDEWIEKVIQTIYDNRQHTFQLLSKRAKRMYEFGKGGCLNLPNLRLGVSISTQPEADEKIPYLLQTPASFRFVSFEPLLSAIDIQARLDGVYSDTINLPNQIIIGCESINGRVGRLGNPEWSDPTHLYPISEKKWLGWAIDLVRQAKEAGVKVFVKQVPINGRVVHDITKFPSELRFQER